MSTYHTPEDLGPDQDERDAAIPGRRFFVYVLETSNGHYVGHTARIRARMREHRDGEVASTAGSDPRLAWRSGPFDERQDAAGFEAALKSMRDSGAKRFTEITGLPPQRFERTYAAVESRDAGPSSRRRLLRSPVALGAVMGAVLGLFWAFDFDASALGVGAIRVAVLTVVCAVGLPIFLWVAPLMFRVSRRRGRGYRRRRRW